MVYILNHKDPASFLLDIIQVFVEVLTGDLEILKQITYLKGYIIIVKVEASLLCLHKQLLCLHMMSVHTLYIEGNTAKKAKLFYFISPNNLSPCTRLPKLPTDQCWSIIVFIRADLVDNMSIRSTKTNLALGYFLYIFYQQFNTF